MRFVVLDTETTGLSKSKHDVASGHRVCEVAALEVISGEMTGKFFHSYINPGVHVSEGALKIHGLTDGFLQQQPEFKQVVKELLAFIGNSTIVIHNAPFDVAFLDKEFRLLPTFLQPKQTFQIIDTLRLARYLFPGMDNTLNALSTRLGVPFQRGDFHTALTDATILAYVFLVLFH